jgi:CheY-like chemotaxis protein
MSFYRTDQVASTILVIDNDPLMLTAIGSVLDMQGHRCVLARNEVMSLDSIAKNQFDVIVLSIDQLQRGCDFAAKLRGPQHISDGQQPANRDVPIIFLVPLSCRLTGCPSLPHVGACLVCSSLLTLTR